MSGSWQDSGSFVDDTLSAGGLLHCPPLQRIYWATTEGACACALMYGGGTAALKALRAVSIVSGFPLSIAICFMCAALHRACKYDLGELDIINSTRFITGRFILALHEGLVACKLAISTLLVLMVFRSPRALGLY